MAAAGPRRELFPSANSASTSGIAHRNRKITHGIRNSPPPFCAAIRGKRQMFPVPTAIPIVARRTPQREVNRSVVWCMFDLGLIRPYPASWSRIGWPSPRFRASS